METIQLRENLSVEVVRGDQPLGGAHVEGALDDGLKRVAVAIREAVDEIGSTIDVIAQKVRPKTLEIEFGVSLTGEVKAVILKGEGSANFKVTASWEFK